MTATATRKGRPKPVHAAQLVEDVVEAAAPTANVQALTLPIDDIAPSPDNPRKSFDEDALEELADSIRAVGILQPIIVRDVLGPSAVGHPERGPRWQIVAGERRWRAAQLAGLERVPANFFSGDDTDARVAQIVENHQREDLSPLELANAIAELCELGLSQAEAARRIGLKGGQSRAAHLLKLRELPGEVQQVLASTEHLKTAHAEALTRWNDFPAFAALVARTAVEESWTAKQIADPDFDSLEEGLETEHPEDDPPQLFVRLQRDVMERVSCATACPFGAFVEEHGGGYYQPYRCLRPEHAKEIRELLNGERVQALQQQVAAAKASPGPASKDATSHTDTEDPTAEIPRLRDLDYRNYTRLDRQDAPRACLRRECACIGRALDYDREVLDICTDPNAFRAKQTQLTKARNAENKRRQVEALSKLEDHVRDHSAVVGTRDLLLLLQTLFIRFGSYGIESRRFAEAWHKASRTWLKDKAPSVERFRGVDRTTLMKLAAELPAPELLKAMVEAICHTDVELRFDPEGGASFGELTDWYVGGALPKRAGNDWQPSEEQPKKARTRA